MLEWGSFVVCVFVFSVALTDTARAAILDIFSDTLEVHSSSHTANTENSQTLTLLQAAKNIDPCPSKGGGDIRIKDNEVLVAEVTPFDSEKNNQVAPQSSDQISLYIVQDGDTLSQVAEMFDVSVNTVVWANELSHNRDIHPGQTLLILPISGVQHTIEKGDTLKSIAKEYGGDSDNIDDFVSEIIEYNGLSDEISLVVGETITLPGGEIEMPEVSMGTTYAVSTGPNIVGYFIHPLPGSVKTQGLHGYNGIDFGAAYGTPIRAAASGRVIVSKVGGWNGGYGNYLVIEHPNGTQTLYSHNSRNAVWQGQNVVAGQVVGYVGSTGRSTGNHLHFEVRGAANPF